MRHHATLLLFPLLLSGCSKAWLPAGSENEPVEKYSISFYFDESVTRTLPLKSIRKLEVFCFNDDALQRIDAHAVYEGACSGNVEFASRAGEKIVVAVANADSLDSGRILCYNDLATATVSLCDDSTDYPIMIAEESIRAGNGFVFHIALRPVASRIRIRGITVDLPGDAKLRNARCYLTGVNARIPLLKEDSFYPTDVLNAYGYSEADQKKMKDPGMLCHSFSSPIDRNGNFEDISLYCYANDAPEESISCPFTRLVIEGTVNGKRQTYSVDINRDREYYDDSQSNQGVGKGCQYIYRLRITKEGEEY